MAFRLAGRDYDHGDRYRGSWGRGELGIGQSLQGGIGVLPEVSYYLGVVRRLNNNGREAWLSFLGVFFGKQIGAGRKAHSENLTYGEEYDRSGQPLGR